MKKIIVGLAGLAGLAVFTSSFSITGKGYRVIDSYVESTPGVHFGVIEGNGAKRFYGANASAKTKDVFGKVKENIKLEGYHSLNVGNLTTIKQIYEYVYTLDCLYAHARFVKHVEVEPGGYFLTDDLSYEVIQVDNPNRYKIIATTTVKGESNSSATATGSLLVHA